MRAKNKNGQSVEYPALKGKVVKQARFSNDEDFTALVIEFKDSTLVSFRLKASIGLSMEPELSTAKDGDIVRWRKLKTRSLR